MPDQRVVVVGGGNVERRRSGTFVTKGPIADYLHSLGREFGHCIWIAQKSGTWGVSLDAVDEGLAGEIDPDLVEVYPVETGLRGIPEFWGAVIRNLRGKPHVVAFLPACTTLAPLMPLVRTRSRALLVYLAGDYIAAARNARAQGRWVWARAMSLGFEACMRSAHAVIARGRYLASLARRHNANVVETFPMGHMGAGVSERIPGTEPEEPRRVLYLGLLQESKGLGDLLHAMRLVADERAQPGVVLHVLGDGPDRGDFEALAAELGLEGHVRFHGWIDDQQALEEFFRSADTLVSPSSSHPEGVPRSIDEALSRGVPVVATRIAGIPDEFSDGEVLLVEPGAPRELAKALDSVLFDENVRDAAIRGARRRQRKWAGVKSAGQQHAMLLRRVGGS